MKKQWRFTLPFLLGNLTTIGLFYLIGHLENNNSEIHNPCVVLTSIVAPTYAVWRVLYYHPLFRPSYHQLTALSPYPSNNRLLLGPIHLNSIDLFMISAFTALYYFSGTRYLTVSIPVFAPTFILNLILFSYSVTHFILLRWKDYPIRSIFIFLIMPVCIWSYRIPWLTTFAVLILYILCASLINDWLKNYPWNTSFEKDVPVSQKNKLFLATLTNSEIGILSPADTIRTISMKKALLICGIITWWIEVPAIIKLFTSTEEIFSISSFFIIFTNVNIILYVSIISRFKYIFSCGLSPISFWGRLRSGQWIIPSYDIIFVAPILAILLTLIPFKAAQLIIKYSTLLPDKLFLINTLCVVPICFFLALLCILKFPPDLTHWACTGPYRILPRHNTPSSRRQRVSVESKQKSTLFWNHLLDKII